MFKLYVFEECFFHASFVLFVLFLFLFVCFLLIFFVECVCVFVLFNDFISPLSIHVTERII